MTPDTKLITVTENEPINSALELIVKNKIRGLPVVSKKGTIVGM